MPPRPLSKSKYLNGLQCSKLLWLLFHEPEKIPEPDAATQYIFDQGHIAGGLAKGLYPRGIDIPEDNFMDNVKQTRELLKQRRTLFEPGILVRNLYARVDILEPVGEDEWDIIEVKSSTKVKDVNIHDAAFQRFCCQQAGLEIRKCFLAHINNQYVRHGEIDPEQFFTVVDITDDVANVSGNVPDRVNDMFETIAASRCPDIGIGKHCSDPYECALSECWDFLPEHNVLQLYYGGQKGFGLLHDGVLTINEIPDDFKLSDKQQVQKQCVISGQPHIDKMGIQDFLSTLQYPLCYLDFETFNPGVPMFDGTRPYQQVPFQFSLHVVQKPGDAPGHHSYLMKDTQDPRPTLIHALKALIGAKGSVVVYNQGFEQSIFQEMAAAFPEYSGWCEDIIGRMVDLLAPFRGFHYYNPVQ
ncbi:MAG: DUF2779 domain-containing protein [Dehalococcoidia bacterium]|nr:DUF2779 domain-containing protein [Dehalococcoidia bacterium]